MADYYLGEDIKIVVKFYDIDDNLTDPVSYSFSIFRPDGTEEINSASLTKDSTGTYHYNFKIPSAGSGGNWTAFVKAEPTSLTTKKEFEFFVKRPIA